jgi:hypothetical protein
MDFVERRKHARYRCEVSVEVRVANEPDSRHGTLADICLGGCYVSLISPLPAGTSVQLSFQVEEAPTVLSGKTVTSLPGSGMGIEFTSPADGDDASRLQTLIHLLEDEIAGDSRILK